VAQVGGAANRRERVQRKVEEIPTQSWRAGHGGAAQRQRDEIERGVADGAEISVDDRGDPVIVGKQVAEVKLPVNDIAGSKIIRIHSGAKSLDRLHQSSGSAVVVTQ